MTIFSWCAFCRVKVLMAMLLSLTGIIAAPVAYGQALDPSDQSVTSPQLDARKAFVSDGSRIEVNQKGFSIKPPPGWEVVLEMPNITMLMQMPAEKPMIYQKNIQIMTFNEPRYIDTTTAEEFAGIIEQKFSQVAGGIVDYRIRRHTITPLSDGSRGISFYGEFAVKGQLMMHAHLLVSSRMNHYLITYSDLAENFEGVQGTENLNLAWESMLSVQLDSRPPMRFAVAIYLAIAISLLLSLAFFLMAVRKSIASRRLLKEDGPEIDDEKDKEFENEDEQKIPSTKAHSNNDGIMNSLFITGMEDDNPLENVTSLHDSMMEEKNTKKKGFRGDKSLYTSRVTEYDDEAS